MFLEMNYHHLFTTNSVSFSKFDEENAILIQAKVLGRKIKGTTLVRYFVKVIARLSFTIHGFTLSKIIRQINRFH